MKNLKKLGAIVLALVMVLSLSVTAFADDTPIASGIAKDANGLTGLTVQVNFKAEAGLTTPAYTFEYSITKGSYQAAGEGPEVKEGIGSLSITGTAAFTANGNQEEQLLLSIGGFDSVIAEAANAGPGIYRYKITQARISADGVNAGILNDKGTGAKEVRYLDLYVEKTTDGYKISSAVLFKVDDVLPAADGSNVVNYNGTPNLTKVDSFENTFGKAGTDPDPNNPDPDDPDYPDPDDPKPSNVGKHTVTVTKTVKGNMGSTTQQFPFSVSVTTNGQNLNGVICEVKKGDDTSKSFKLEEGGTFTLADGEQVVITVPNNVTVHVQETIKEGEGYTVTNEFTPGSAAVLDDTTPVQNQLEGSTGAKKIDEKGLKTSLTLKDQNPTMAYTNTRSAISPTGVVLTFAPYFFMMAAAIVLVLFTRRREEEQA